MTRLMTLLIILSGVSAFAVSPIPTPTPVIHGVNHQPKQPIDVGAIFNKKFCSLHPDRCKSVVPHVAPKVIAHAKAKAPVAKIKAAKPLPKQLPLPSATPFSSK